MDDRDVMRLHADILFRYDDRGRMLCSNSPDCAPAPRFFLGSTIGGHIARFGAEVPDAVVQRLSEIVERWPPLGGVRLPSAVQVPVREALERHAPITREGDGPAYRFPESLSRPAEVVQVTDANLEIVRDTYPWLLEELAGWWPCFAVVCDGAAVSVCFSARIGADAAEAGVDTLPAFRGQGYAAAVTAAWGAAVRDGGRIPLYSTSWDNHASQGVARRLGLIRFGADATWA